jgi:multidrug efflux pump subunit AcrB
MITAGNNRMPPIPIAMTTVAAILALMPLVLILLPALLKIITLFV